MPISQKVIVWCLSAMVAVSSSACRPVAQPAVDPQPQIVTITAHDHRYEVPSMIAEGLITFTIENAGAEPHHAQVARLKEGITMEQVTAAAQQGIPAVMELVDFVGGPSNAEPGEQALATVLLAPGNYILICFIPSPDGVAHMAKGMITPFTVQANQATAAAVSAAAPQADQTIDMYDFAYTMPDSVPAGPQIWQIINTGPQVHEMALFKLAPGKTIQDFLAFQQAPQGMPPFTHAGGVQFLDDQSEAWAHLDLTPGAYVANCFVPDPASAKPHMLLGMVRQFTVTPNGD